MLPLRLRNLIMALSIDFYISCLTLNTFFYNESKRSIIALVPPARWRGWSLLELFLILDPVVLVGVGGVDHLGDDFVVGLQDQDGPRVLVLPAVVGGRKDCYQRTPRESLETVHDALVGPDDHVQVVLGQEAFHPVWAELDDVARLGGVSEVIGVDAQLAV